MPENETTEGATDIAPGDITDFIIVLTQLDKGRTQLELSNALHEVVDSVVTHGKKAGSVTLKVKVEPLDSGAVRLVADVTSSPVKDPAGTIFFADGEGCCPTRVDSHQNQQHLEEIDMIIYRCTECGDDIPGHADGTPKRIRWQAITCTTVELHFCTVGCLTDWAADSGYRDDAEAGQ